MWRDVERGSLDRDVDNGDVVVRLVRLGVGLDEADVLADLHAARAPAEHGVLVVQPRLRGRRGSDGQGGRRHTAQTQTALRSGTGAKGTLAHLRHTESEVRTERGPTESQLSAGLQTTYQSEHDFFFL